MDIDDAQLKLADFGFAVKCNGLDQRAMLGTPGYVAPEILNNQNYGTPVDMWSCGVIIFVILGGYPPFPQPTGNNMEELYKKICDADFTFDPQWWGGVSHEAKDLIQGCLTVDVNKRLTAPLSLHDPWVEHRAPKSSAEAPEGLVGNLKKYQAKNKFVQTTLRMIAWRLDDEHINKLREVFEALDEDGVGVLTPAKLKEGLTKLHADHGESLEELKEILERVNAGHHDEIDYTEFIAAMMDRKTYLQRDACWQAFRVYDKNGDGKIDISELEAVFSCGSVENAMGKDAIDKLMKDADTNGDGELDFEEFMAMMISADGPGLK
jgi:calcium-dependent protein kinase